MLFSGHILNVQRMEKLTFTHEAYVREHGRFPFGRGSWAFQASRDYMARSQHLHGEVLFFNGSLQECKRALAATGATGLWAVMP